MYRISMIENKPAGIVPIDDKMGMKITDYMLYMKKERIIKSYSLKHDTVTIPEFENDNGISFPEKTTSLLDFITEHLNDYSDKIFLAYHNRNMYKKVSKQYLKRRRWA